MVGSFQWWMVNQWDYGEQWTSEIGNGEHGIIAHTRVTFSWKNRGEKVRGFFGCFVSLDLFQSRYF